MECRVAFGTECNQVLLVISAGLAPEFQMMDLQVLHAAAGLAAPAIAIEDLPLQFAITISLESEWGDLEKTLPHEASRLISDRNTCCCGLGRNLK